MNLEISVEFMLYFYLEQTKIYYITSIFWKGLEILSNSESMSTSGIWLIVSRYHFPVKNIKGPRKYGQFQGKKWMGSWECFVIL